MSLRVAAAPSYVLWEITRACNLRCRHCLSRSGAAAPGELDPEEALAVCDDLAAAGVGAVALMGGEPLLRPDWPKLAARLRDAGIAVALATNGLLLDEACARRARECGVSQVVIGLDGGCEAHERIRGPGSFEPALRALDAAATAGMESRLVVTSVHRGNADQLEPLLGILLERAPGAGWAINFTSIRHDARMPRAMRADVGIFREVAAFLERERPRHAGRLELMASHDLGYCARATPELQPEPWRGCVAGLETLGITASGGLKGCLALSDSLVEADVRDRPIAELWADPDAFAYNRRFVAADLRGRCQGCPEGARCRGGCLDFGLTMEGEAHHAPFCLRRIERGEER